MREFRTYGSARGAPSNGRPYRDPRSPPANLLNPLFVPPTSAYGFGWQAGGACPTPVGENVVTLFLRPDKVRTEEAVGYVLPTRDRALAPEAVGNHGMNLQAVNPPASPVSNTVSSCE